MAIVRISDAAGRSAGLDTRPRRTGTVSAGKMTAVQKSELVELDAAGCTLAVQWAPVLAADRAEMANATLTFAAAGIERRIEAGVTSSGAARIIDLGATLHLKRVVLKDPVYLAGESRLSINTASRLESARVRFVLSADLGTGAMTPCRCVPGLGWRGMLPPAVPGMSISNGVLSLEPLTVRTFRLSLVQGSAPEDFVEVPFEAQEITFFVLCGPENLTVKSADESTLWSFPGELPVDNRYYPVDLTHALEMQLNAAVHMQEPLEASVSMRAADGGMVRLCRPTLRGQLIRTLPGITRVMLEGAQAGLNGLDRLADETPHQVRGDLALRYEGIRLVPQLCDPQPSTPGTSGTVVSGLPVVRPLDVRLLQGCALARIGLIGRAPVACELAVCLVELVNGCAGSVLCDETTVMVDPAEHAGTHWAAPLHWQIEATSVALAVRAVSGRFLWAHHDERPALCAAVHDPRPPATAVTLEGHRLLDWDGTPVNLRSFTFPAAPFRSCAPRLHSLLFATVDISDLELRYAR